MHKWLPKDGIESERDQALPRPVERSKGRSSRSPKIRWSEEEDDEFLAVPKVFLRQDQPVSGPRNGLSRRLMYSSLIIVLLFCGLATLTAAMPEAFSPEKLQQLRALVINATHSFDVQSVEEAEDGSAPLPADVEQSAAISAEALSKARTALTDAINSQIGTSPTEVSAIEPELPKPEATETDQELARPSVEITPENTEKQQTAGERETALSKASNAPSGGEHSSPALLSSASQSVSPNQVEVEPAPAVSSVRFPDMVGISGGEFTIPTSRGSQIVNAEATVQLSAFEIARTEVSRRDWLTCMSAEACSSEGFDESYFEEGQLDLPITSITFAQTEDYITWLNKKRPEGSKPYRLPTEAEWVVAARGATPEAKAYPWGDKFDPEQTPTQSSLIPVTQAHSLNSLVGMVGNAEERVSGCWGATLESGDCFRNLGVVRGAPLGRFTDKTTHLTYRRSRARTAPYSTVGFRLAR